MARMRVFIVLALAIAAGGTFAFGTYRYMQNVPTQTVGVPTSGVVVAAADLQLGTELRREDLHVIQWPAGAVPMGAFTKPEELVGRGLIQPVAANELFLPGKLAAKEAGAGLPPVIAPGYRADLVLLDLTRPDFVPLNDALLQLVFSEAGAAVDTVMIDGRVVLDRGRMVTIDEGKVRVAAEAAAARLREANTGLREAAAKIAPFIGNFCLALAREPYHIARVFDAPPA